MYLCMYVCTVVIYVWSLEGKDSGLIAVMLCICSVVCICIDGLLSGFALIVCFTFSVVLKLLN